ncbi:hypothetical protein GCM10010344_62980 [Streptomyces bluensis]|nr:hypothetical protein GCM10010344_62980 [Streptomyces bluensis]
MELAVSWKPLVKSKANAVRMTAIRRKEILSTADALPLDASCEACGSCESCESLFAFHPDGATAIRNPRGRAPREQAPLRRDMTPDVRALSWTGLC